MEPARCNFMLHICLIWLFPTRTVNFMATIEGIHKLPFGSHVCMYVWIQDVCITFSTTCRINQIAGSKSRSALAHSYWSAIGTWWSLLIIYVLQAQNSMSLIRTCTEYKPEQHDFKFAVATRQPWCSRSFFFKQFTLDANSRVYCIYQF